MEVVPLASEQEIAELAAGMIEALVRGNPDAVLGLATGSTPLPVYRELISRHRSGTAPSYAQVRTFNLDEYVGLPDGHEQTYRETIQRELTDALGIDRSRVHGPDPDPEHLSSAGARYESEIRAAHGIDLQVLGLGTNGHLAFNEQGSSLASLTRIKTLTQRTREDNARFFDSVGQVPRHVLTQGIGTIMRARHLVLLALGEAKADAVAAMIEGPISASCPGSAVQMHSHATVLLDEPAAAKLQRLDYYREVYANKPAWQGL